MNVGKVGYATGGTTPPAASGRSIGILGGKRLHQIDDPAAHLDVTDLDEGPVELKPFGTAAEFDGERHRGVFGKSPVATGGLPARGILEEESDGNAQDGGDRLQTAGANPVRALFVLLDLLKGDAEIFTQLFLAHSKHIATQPDATPDMDIDRIRLLLVLFCHFF